MKGFFIVLQNELEKSSGVTKKINSQLEVFNNHFETTLIHENFKKNYIRKFISRLPLTPNNWGVKHTMKFFDCDFIYCRSDGFDRFFIKFFKKQKKVNKNCKIIVEVPDYPRRTEIRKHLNYTLPSIIKDVLAIKHLHKHVDRIATFSDCKSIWGISAVNIKNGCAVSKIKKKTACLSTDEINLIGVAGPNANIAYDRLIQGLSDYYLNGGKRKIFFHIVGSGAIFDNWLNSVKHLKLEQNIVFHGKITGNTLDELYNSVEIGVDDLGFHRIGINYSSSLKSREYLAKGIPIITASEVDVFVGSEFPYHCRFPSDDTPIDINKVVAFYDRVYVYSGKSKQDIINETRKFAEETCDIAVTMLPVINYIKCSTDK